MVRRLPSLNGVRAFEAAGRHESFAQAADELGVSPAAVSRMVRLLEDRLGVELFVRGPNALSLTPAGRLYRDGLTPLLDSLVSLTDRVTAASGPRVLTVGVGPTFAIRWLIPRLADFRAAEPGIEVRLTTGGAAAPFGADWSCGIALGDGTWPGLVAEPLIEADLTPVCAPGLAGELRQVEDLSGDRMLHVAHAPEDWPRWFAATGRQRPSGVGLTVEFYGQALQAAADGAGVAMGIRPYIDDDLAAGRLIAPFDVSVPKGRAWYLIYREYRASEPAFVAFRRWIAAAVAAS